MKMAPMHRPPGLTECDLVFANLFSNKALRGTERGRTEACSRGRSGRGFTYSLASKLRKLIVMLITIDVPVRLENLGANRRSEVETKCLHCTFAPPR